MGLEKLDWLSNEGISGWLGELVKERKETNKILRELTISIKAFFIGEALKKEDKVEKSVESNVHGSFDKEALSSSQVPTDSKALPEPLSVNPITEEVTMDLKGVTGMAQTPKAILVTKMGLQKWIPLSCLVLEEDTLKADGHYYEELKLGEGKSWILEKPWDKLEVRKS